MAQIGVSHTACKKCGYDPQEPIKCDKCGATLYATPGLGGVWYAGHHGWCAKPEQRCAHMVEPAKGLVSLVYSLFHDAEGKCQHAGKVYRSATKSWYCEDHDPFPDPEVGHPEDYMD